MGGGQEILRLRTVVPRDHRIEIVLPENVPEGPADVEVTVTPTNVGDNGDWRVRRMAWLAELDAVRKKHAHLNVRLSEAVIEMRREEG